MAMRLRGDLVIAILVAFLVALPSVSWAQSILIVDLDALVTGSRAYASSVEQVAAARAEQQKYFASAEKQLRDESQHLAAQRDQMSTEEFAVYQQAFEDRVRQMQERARGTQAAINQALAQALTQIRATVLEISHRLGVERGASAIIQRRATVTVIDEASDITQLVAKELDDTQPHVQLQITIPDEQGL